MKNFVLLALVVLLEAGCLPKNITGPFKEHQNVTDALEEQSGLETSVSFKMNNGKFTQYSIAVIKNENNLSHDKISELVSTIVVREHTTPPKRVFIAYPIDITNEK